MNLKRVFASAQHSQWGDAALLLVRVVVGLAMILHGWSKIQHPFGWMGADSTMPAVLQSLAAVSEFGGGMALISGLLVPLASFGIACTMAVAFYTMAFKMSAPFVAASRGPSSELPAVYFCIAVLLIALGPGRYSLDRLFFGRK